MRGRKVSRGKGQRKEGSEGRKRGRKEGRKEGKRERRMPTTVQNPCMGLRAPSLEGGEGKGGRKESGEEEEEEGWMEGRKRN
jgi:hypothetical protein